MSKRVLVVGAENVGTLIAVLLAASGDYIVHLADRLFNDARHLTLKQAGLAISTIALDPSDGAALSRYLISETIDAMISCLPSEMNLTLAIVAKRCRVAYFDLSDSDTLASDIEQLANGSQAAFVSQCGISPGYLSIVATHLMQAFDTPECVELRLGTLPQTPSTTLQQNSTRCAEALINNVTLPVTSIISGVETRVKPLDDVEPLSLNGKVYEAVNAAGGFASLSRRCLGKLTTLNYKIIRYPGFTQKMQVLTDCLDLSNDRVTLKQLLAPGQVDCKKDIVLLSVRVAGHQQGKYRETHYQKTLLPQQRQGMDWSAVEMASASAICAVIDRVLIEGEHYTGSVCHTQFSLQDIHANRFGQYYL